MHTLPGYVEPNVRAPWLQLASSFIAADAPGHTAVLSFQPVVPLCVAGAVPVAPTIIDYLLNGACSRVERERQREEGC